MNTRWLHEPLLHFLLLGTLIFAIDRAVDPAVDEAKRIRIDDDVRSTLLAKFEEGQGRAPSDDEFADLLARWVQNEVMYREALSLGLDKGDEMIRARIVLKMRNLVFSNITVDVPQDAVLRAWFEDNRERYGTPRRYDFVQVVLSGHANRSEARLLAASLHEEDAIADYADRVRRYRYRSRENIAATFGDAFADVVANGEPGAWSVAESTEGWHLVRVEKVAPAIPGEFEANRARVEADWTLAQQKASVIEQLRVIRDRYEILREDRS